MKALTKYLLNREIAIYKILSKPPEKFTAGTFHELRVQLKKMSALLDLLNFSSSNFEFKKTFKPFKKIFHKAGRVREIQVEEIMIKKYLYKYSLKDYRKNLKKQQSKEKREFFAIVNEKFIERLENKFRKISPFILAVNNNKVKFYIDEKKKHINKIIRQKILQPEHIHELRKQLKKLNYNRKFLPVQMRNKPHPKSEILPKLLGKWHDCQVIIDHLNKTKKIGGISPNEIVHIKKIITKITSESDALFLKINRAMTNYF